MTRGLLLILWGWVMIWSVVSGRLGLLLREMFHSLVWISGAALMIAGLTIFLRSYGQWERVSLSSMAAALMALLVLIIPPNPSFSDLATNRPQELPEPPELAFVLPPEQRTLTEWVQLLRNQPDPDLVDGDPVVISGFVWIQNDRPPLIARLIVRCCLADATPAGLLVDWPDDAELKTNQWLKIQGQMKVAVRNEQRVAVVVPQIMTPIPRPKRPLEP
ncbi:TIGR03943 family protein [Synechococcus sp. M16CYN]|uniref:TIGR03943 family putative permease subunit n=1 Tax=Synechococcus sp. M16CYN TaxID=3103139 RepID=UPI0032535FF4